jgi:Phage integrase, N-terminal SAM-like domain
MTAAVPLAPVSPVQSPRLLDQFRAAGHNEPTITVYASWVCRFIVFHGKRHPRELRAAAVARSLGQVVRTDKKGKKGTCLL